MELELIHILVIVGIAVVVLLAIILFRVNTHIQMRVSFNMDDECNIYNQKGLVIFIDKHQSKLTNPTLVVVEITNLMMIYKLQEEKKKFMVKLADLLLHGLKSEETLARLAFNKFCVLYNNRKREEIQEIGKEFEKYINSSKFEYNSDIQFRIYYGVYEKPVFKEITLDIRDAEASIRFSPLKDKNFYYFSPDVTKYLLKKETINAAKKSAYDEKRIISYIQPKVSLKTGRVCGGEILCRWVDEQYKPIYFPDEFIPIFEENGFVKQVDMLMLQNACQLVQTLIRRGNDDIVISVNLSKANFESENCIQKILDVVNIYEIPFGNIEFEVTETAIMNSPAYVSDEIMQLRQLGFKVAMDDFGKEYSSLGSLSDNPYDTIKLDGIFFKNGLTVDKERFIAENLISMLAKLNVEIVCEGVEDKETVDYIGSICDECVIQGYVFSKPIPLNQFEAFIDTQYEFEFEHREVGPNIPAHPGYKKVNKPGKISDDKVRELEERLAEMQDQLRNQQYMANQPNYGYGQPYPQYPYGQPYPQYPPYGQPYPAYGQPYPQQGQPYPQQGQPYPQQGQPAQGQMAQEPEEEVKPSAVRVKPIKKIVKDEEAPVEEVELEEPVAEETPVEEAQPEEAVTEETPVEETQSEEAVAEETPVEETQPEEEAAEEAPVEEAQPEEAVTEETPVEEVQPEEAVTEETPVEEAQPEEAVTEETPTEEKKPAKKAASKKSKKDSE